MLAYLLARLLIYPSLRFKGDMLRKFLIASFLVLLLPQTAMAAPKYYKGYGRYGTPFIMMRPTRHTGWLGFVNNGQRIQITCQTVGQTIKGYKVWDKISYPRAGWVFDRYTNTPGQGRFTPGIPKCIGRREAAAIKWAKSQIGVAGWALWCERFSARAYGRPYSGYATAQAHYNSLSRRGLIHKDKVPMPGALVYWSSPYGGHVAIALGNGEVITTPLRRGARVYKAKLSSFSGYLGWAFAPSPW